MQNFRPSKLPWSCKKHYVKKVCEAENYIPDGAYLQEYQ